MIYINPSLNQNLNPSLNHDHSNSIGNPEQRKGLKNVIGGTIGAIPGTMLAHPLDRIKVEMQARGVQFTHALKAVSKQGLIGATTTGLGAAISQKVVTRFTMFAGMELGRELFNRLGFEKGSAVICGAVLSGGISGFCSGPFEQLKVLKSLGLVDVKTSTAKHLKSQFKTGGTIKMLRLYSKPALRNSVFDGLFAGTRWFGQEHGISNKVIYPMAAGVAVFGDYAVDRAVKATYSIRIQHQPKLLDMLTDPFKFGLLKGIKQSHNGMGVKMGEFFVSYLVTACVSDYMENIVDKI